MEIGCKEGRYAMINTQNYNESNLFKTLNAMGAKNDRDKRRICR